MPNTIQALLLDDVKFATGIEAILPANAPKISARLIAFANRTAVLPKLPINLPNLPNPPALKPPGPNPSPTTGTLVLTVSPASAVVTINSQVVAPGTYSKEVPGTYSWEATANGYTPKSGTFTITAGQITPLNITLSAIPAESIQILQAILAEGYYLPLQIRTRCNAARDFLVGGLNPGSNFTFGCPAGDTTKWYLTYMAVQYASVLPIGIKLGNGPWITQNVPITVTDKTIAELMTTLGI